MTVASQLSPVTMSKPGVNDLLVRLSHELACCLELYQTPDEIVAEVNFEAIDALRETRDVLSQSGIPASDAVENVLNLASRRACMDPPPALRG